MSKNVKQTISTISNYFYPEEFQTLIPSLEYRSHGPFPSMCILHAYIALFSSAVPSSSLPLNPISQRRERERSDEEEAMTALSSFPILAHQSEYPQRAFIARRAGRERRRASISYHLSLSPLSVISSVWGMEQPRGMSERVGQSGRVLTVRDKQGVEGRDDERDRLSTSKQLEGVESVSVSNYGRLSPCEGSIVPGARPFGDPSDASGL